MSSIKRGKVVWWAVFLTWEDFYKNDRWEIIVNDMLKTCDGSMRWVVSDEVNHIAALAAKDFPWDLPSSSLRKIHYKWKLDIILDTGIFTVGFWLEKSDRITYPQNCRIAAHSPSK